MTHLFIERRINLEGDEDPICGIFGVTLQSCIEDEARVLIEEVIWDEFKGQNFAYTPGHMAFVYTNANSYDQLIDLSQLPNPEVFIQYLKDMVNEDLI